MRKHATLLCVLALLYLCTGFAFAAQTHKLSDSPTGMQLLGQDRSGLTMELSVGEVMFVPVDTKAGDFTMISIKGCGRSFDLLGEPDLPKANKLLAIPIGAELRAQVVSYEMDEIDLTELGIETPLLPTQPSLSKSDDPDFVPFEYNQSVYAEKGFYSHELITTEELGIMRGVRIGRIAISPVEYNPTGNTVRVYKNIVVQVDFVGSDWPKSELTFQESYSPFFEAVYNRLFNYSPSMFTANKGDLTKYPITYLIVSDPMFETQLEPFVDWKVQKGFNVIEAYTDDIGTSKTAIKSWIQNQYNTLSPKPSFVLLVGDDEQIEAWSGTAGSHISDLYYCEFTSDVFPEIYYGRFSAQNSNQLQPQIDKTLEYERYEMPDPSYLEEVTLIAGVDGTYAITHGNGQINYGTSLYFNLAHGIDPNVWLYPDSDDPGASAAIIQTVNDGIGFANYTAHCGHSSWGDPSFTTSDINGLTNIHKYLLAIGNCCSSNTFGDPSSPCWGEAWLQAENKGGIGYIGASNSTYWYEDYYWGVGYGPVIGSGPTYEETGPGAYDGIFHDHGEPDSMHYVSNDAIIFAGNMGVTEGGSRVTYYWEAYHLMGDPSVTSYMGVPSANLVTYPSTIMITEPSITVQAAPGSYVGISFNGVLHGAGHVDNSGQVTIDLDPFAQPCVADIVVTGQNLEPYISTIQVITPSGPYVIYDESDINDATGNNNGMIDLGESIVMGVQVKNVGPDDAYNVDATLTTTSTYVTLTDDNEFYGTVTGNDGLGYSASAFAFDVHTDVPDGHAIPFELNVNGDAKDLWTSNFVYTVHAPVLDNLSLTIDDATGNGNSILDPGETADIVVTLGNSGSGIAASVTGVLSENDSFLSLDDPNGTFGDISPDGGVADNAADVFTASADASTPMGYAVPMTLAVTSPSGYTVDLNLMITVGDRVVFYYDDFAFDQGWTGLGGSAEWEIASCQGLGGDPSTDHSPTTDNQVLGNDLSGDGEYENSISTTQWVTKWIDCSDYNGIQLRFQRWLGVERNSYDHAYFEVFDGSTWHRLYENGSSTINETSWNEQYFDVSDYADGNPYFEIRFGMGSTDGSQTHCGWNVDDIEMKGYYQGTGGIPNISLSPSAVQDSLLDDQVAQETVRVYNTGDGELRVRFNPGVDWITCNTDNNYVPAGDSLDFTFDVNTTGMAPGNHSGSLMFTSNDPGTISGEVPVNIYIHAPSISLAGMTCADSLVEGQTSQHTVHIDNVGQGNLHVSFSTTDGWLDCSEEDNLLPPGGSLDFVIDIDATGMAPGNHTGTVEMTCNDPSHTSDNVTVDLYIYEPLLNVTQTSIDVELGQLEEVTELLTIANDGPGRLHYTLDYVMLDMKAVKGAGGTLHLSSASSTTDNVEPLGFRIADPDKTGIEEPYYPPVEKGSGGPDDYGYRWIDSDEPGGPTYDWIDISAVGTDVTLADDGISSAIPMGFGFPFYNNIYSDVYIASNGYLTFESTPSSYTSNQDLPDPQFPDNLIAMFWDDLNPAAGGDIYYYYDAANERFIVSYVNVPIYKSGAGTGSLTFQAVLYPTGRIVTQYGTMDPGDNYLGLEGATVGIENADASDGLTVAYNAAYMHDNLAIKISSTAWLSLGSVSGTIEPYNTDQVEVIFNSNELDFGSYDGLINIDCDDPANPSHSVPVSLLVFDNSYICGDADGSGGVDIDDIVFTINYVFSGGTPPDPVEAADVNCTGGVDIDDVVYLVGYVFNEGPEPCADCK